MSERSFRRQREREAESARRRNALRGRRAGRTATIAAGALALGAPAAQAANLEVNSTADATADGCDIAAGGCTLRDALTVASGNMEVDTVTFNSSVTGTIRLTQGQLVHSGNYALTVNGPGQDALTISGDADNSGEEPNAGDSRVLEIGGNGLVTIRDLTLADGYVSAGPGGAIYSNTTGDLTIEDSRITGSSASAAGGAVAASANGNFLTVTDSLFDSNDATGGGGAISAPAGVNVSNSEISGNETGGGGGAILASGKYAPVTLTDSTITGNEAAAGGALYTDTFSDNPQPGKYVGGDADTTIARSTFSQNTATGAGGGISFGPTYVDTFPVPATANISIAQSTFSGNEAGAASNGGAIAFRETLQDTPVFLTSSTVSGNEAGAGAGISFAPPPAAALTGGTTAFELGNSTISGNTAALRGGGLYLGAYDTGGGPTSPTIPLAGTIVADNLANGSPQDLDRADTSGGGGFPLAFSLVEAPGDAPVPQDPAGSAIVGQDPQLGALAANGGPTQTRLPALTSPAIDKGRAANGVTTDQRGSARVVDQTGVANAAGGDASDIGSVEREPAPVTPQQPATKKKKCKKKKKKGKNAGAAKKKKCKKKKKK